MLLLFWRRQHRFQPERVEPQFPHPSSAVIEVLVFFLFNHFARFLLSPLVFSGHERLLLLPPSRRPGRRRARVRAIEVAIPAIGRYRSWLSPFIGVRRRAEERTRQQISSGAYICRTAIQRPARSSATSCIGSRAIESNVGRTTSSGQSRTRPHVRTTQKESPVRDCRVFEGLARNLHFVYSSTSKVGGKHEPQYR